MLNERGQYTHIFDFRVLSPVRFISRDSSESEQAGKES